MKQYNDIMNKIITEGEWIENTRTGKKCKTIINADMEYDFCPLVTTRKSYWKSAVAEFVGYIRGYDNAAQFSAIGTKTWDANANENQAWLNNPYRKGKDDMGRVYGVQGRGWRMSEWYKLKDEYIIPRDDETYTDINARLVERYKPYEIDQLKKIYDNLKQGIDDRGEIMSFYNVGEFHMGCLRPCVHTHTFSLVNGTLHLTSYSRSMDVPLGGNFNLVQCYFFLKLMCQITGHKQGNNYLKVVNAHIYEDQYETALIESARTPFDCVPDLIINPRIKTLEDVETIFTLDDVSVTNYKCHPPLSYPMSA